MPDLGTGNHSSLLPAGLGEQPSLLPKAAGPPLTRALLQMGDKSSLPTSAGALLPQLKQWRFPLRSFLLKY